MYINPEKMEIQFSKKLKQLHLRILTTTKCQAVIMRESLFRQPDETETCKTNNNRQNAIRTG